MSRPTWQERLFAKAAPDANGCWIWQARSVMPNGYAYFWGPDGIEASRTSYAHRWAHIATKGPIPAGLEIDHLCNVRRCINPEHLEAVTHAENRRRAGERQTHCKHGHERTETNTYWYATGSRACKDCHQVRYLARKARRQAVAA